MESDNIFKNNEDKFILGMIELGFTDTEAREQLGKLDDIFQVQVASRVTSEALTEQESIDLIGPIIAEVYVGYFKAITKDVGPEKIAKFEEITGLKVS